MRRKSFISFSYINFASGKTAFHKIGQFVHDLGGHWSVRRIIQTVISLQNSANFENRRSFGSQSGWFWNWPNANVVGVFDGPDNKEKERDDEDFPKCGQQIAFSDPRVLQKEDNDLPRTLHSLVFQGLLFELYQIKLSLWECQRSGSKWLNLQSGPILDDSWEASF